MARAVQGSYPAKLRARYAARYAARSAARYAARYASFFVVSVSSAAAGVFGGPGGIDMLATGAWQSTGASKRRERTACAPHRATAAALSCQYRPTPKAAPTRRRVLVSIGSSMGGACFLLFSLQKKRKRANAPRPVFVFSFGVPFWLFPLFGSSWFFPVCARFGPIRAAAMATVAASAAGATPAASDAAPSAVGARRGKDEVFAVCVPFPDEFVRCVGIMAGLLESVQLQVVKPAASMAASGVNDFEGLRVDMLDPSQRASFRLKLHAQTDAPPGTRDRFVVNVKTLVQLLQSMRLTPDSIMHLARLRGDDASVSLTRIDNHDMQVYTLPTLEKEGVDSPELEDLQMPVSCSVLTDRLKAHMRTAVDMHATEVRVSVQKETEREEAADAAAAPACFLVMSFAVGGVTRTDVLQSVMVEGGSGGESGGGSSLVVGEVSAEWRRLRDEGRVETLCAGRYPVPFLAAMTRGLDKSTWITLCLGQDPDGQAMPLMLQLPIGTVNSEVRMLLAPCA